MQAPNPSATAFDFETSYNVAITSYEVYLMRVREAFDGRCQAIKEEYLVKLKNATTAEERKKLIDEEKTLLGQVLGELKSVIEKNHHEARKELEEIEHRKEEYELALEMAEKSPKP